MPALSHNDITAQLDEVFAKNSIAKLLPNDGDLNVWRKIKQAEPSKINAKGGWYLVQTQGANHIEQVPFSDAHDGAQFPIATASKYKTMTVAALKDVATLQWTGNVLDQQNATLKQRPAKAMDQIANDVEDIYGMYARTRARQLWQNRTNELARVSAINTGTGVVTCNNAGNLFDVQLLHPGIPVEVRDGSGTLKGYVNVDTVQRPSRTFLIKTGTVQGATGAATVLGAGVGELNIANNDRLYPRGGYNNGWSGIPHLIATSGAFQSVADRTEHDHLTGVSVNAAGAALSASLMRRLRSAIRNRRNAGHNKGKFYASAQVDAFEATAFATQRYGQTTTLDLGYGDDELKFDGKGFVFNFYVPKNEVYEIDLTAIDRFELREFKPLRGENGYRFLAPNTLRHNDMENMYFKGIGNLGAEKPIDVGGVLTGLSTAGLSLGSE